MKIVETKETTPQLYEVAFMAREEQGLDRARAILKEHRAVILSEQPIAKVKLAYPIKKAAFAFFGIIRFESSPELLVTLTHDFHVDGAFLRHMMHVAPKEKPAEKETTEETNPRRQSFTRATRRTAGETGLTNADLEKKIEEISQTEA